MPTEEDFKRIERELEKVRSKVHEHGSALAIVEDVKERVGELAEKVDTLTTAVNIRMSEHDIESATRSTELIASAKRAHERIDEVVKSKESGRQNWLSVLGLAAALLAIIVQLSLSISDRNERAIERARQERTQVNGKP